MPDVALLPGLSKMRDLSRWMLPYSGQQATALTQGRVALVRGDFG